MFHFKDLLELWRKDNLLDQAFNDSYEMLGSTREMYAESIRSLRHSDRGEISLNVYERDQQVNRYEREVRSKVLQHLAITGGTNIIPGLILTSIVIDVERIGDYTKNIMDLAVVHPQKLVCGKNEDELQKIERAVGDLFDAVLPAVRQTDKEKTVRLIRENNWILKRCDAICNMLIKGEDDTLSAGDAVSTSLYARYLKRIAAHMMNVASSVVNPFEKIGFAPESNDE